MKTMTPAQRRERERFIRSTAASAASAFDAKLAVAGIDPKAGGDDEPEGLTAAEMARITDLAKARFDDAHYNDFLAALEHLAAPEVSATDDEEDDERTAQKLSAMDTKKRRLALDALPFSRRRRVAALLTASGIGKGFVDRFGEHAASIRAT